MLETNHNSRKQQCLLDLKHYFPKMFICLHHAMRIGYLINTEDLFNDRDNGAISKLW